MAFSSPRHCRPQRAAHRAVALSLCLVTGWAAAAALPSRPDRAAEVAVGSRSEARNAAAWWQGFHDPAMTALVDTAAGDAPRATAIAQAWIAAQVFHVQAVTTAEIARSARAEQALLMNAPPDTPRRDELLSVLAQRLEGAEEAEQDRLARRNEQLERLGGLTSLAPAALAALAQPRLDALALPQFEGAVQAGSNTTDAAVLGELQRLEEHERQTVQALAAARALQQEYQALRATDPAEPDAQIAVLQSYQRMLLQGQQVAARSGDLALAWLRLLHAHGGRLGAYGAP